MRRLHIVLLSLAIALGTAGSNTWAQRGGGHGGGGGGFHSGGGGGFRGGYSGGNYRGGYGGYRGGYGGWGYGRGWGGWGYGYGLGWGPWSYWPGYYGYYGGYPYPYYPYYPGYNYDPGYSYSPDYSPNPCQPYGPYNCRISGPRPSSYAPNLDPAGPPRAVYSELSTPPSAYTPTTRAHEPVESHVADGQWHRFGPPAAPAMRASAAPIAPKPAPAGVYTVSEREPQ